MPQWSKYLIVVLMLLAPLAYFAGRQDEHEAVQQHQVDSIKVLEVDTLKVFIHDTVVLHKKDSIVKVMHDTLAAEPQLIHDTVFVKQYISDLDTALKVCTNTVTTCEHLHQQDSATIKALQQEKKPSIVKPLVIGTSIGAALVIALRAIFGH